jgi:hypothetical protein
MSSEQPDLGYLDATVALMRKIEAEQRGNIEQAADLMVEAIAADRLIHVYGGGGHTTLVMGEMFFRAGGLANINPIMETGLSVFNQALKYLELERCVNYGRSIMKILPPGAGRRADHLPQHRHQPGHDRRGPGRPRSKARRSSPSAPRAGRTRCRRIISSATRAARTCSTWPTWRSTTTTRWATARSACRVRHADRAQLERGRLLHRPPAGDRDGQAVRRPGDRAAGLAKRQRAGRRRVQRAVHRQVLPRVKSL